MERPGAYSSWEDDMEALIIRAGQMLAFGRPVADIHAAFVKEGVPGEIAHLAIRAAQVWDKMDRAG